MCEAERCVSQVGFPVKDCGGGLRYLKGYIFGFAVTLPAQATLLSFGFIPRTDGAINLLLYSDLGDRPNRLVAQSGERQFMAYGGPLEYRISDVPLAAGKYWLMGHALQDPEPQVCVSLSGPQIPLWQTFMVFGPPPETFPAPSVDTYISYQNPWNMYVTVRTAGTR